MSDIQNNPAARLLAVLEEANEFAVARSCKDVWMSVLVKDDEREQSILLQRLGKVMALPSEIQSELNEVDGIDVGRYTHWQAQVSRAFENQNLMGDWKSFTQHIDVHTFNYLSVTADLLSTHRPQATLSESQLETIRGDLEELITEIGVSDFDDDIKKYLLRLLREARNAIAEYELTGIAPILNVLESSFGHAVLNRDFIERTRDSEVGNKFWQFMHRTAIVVTVASGAQNLISPVLQTLLPFIEESVSWDSIQDDGRTDEAPSIDTTIRIA